MRDFVTSHTPVNTSITASPCAGFSTPSPVSTDTTIDATGCHFTEPKGTAEEMAALDASYEHLCKMRDEIIGLGIVPATAEWSKENPNL